MDNDLADIIAATMDSVVKRTQNTTIPKIERYTIEGNTVGVWFEDGSKTFVTCCEDDEFDLELAIEKCILKKLCGENFKVQIRDFIRLQQKLEKSKEEALLREKEEQIRIQNKRRKNAEKRMRMKARYEARYQIMLEEEKKKLKNRKPLMEEI